MHLLRPRRTDPVAAVVGGAALVLVALERGLGAAAVVVAAVSVPLVVADVRHRLLPNVLTVPVLVAGTAEAVALGGAGRGAAAALTTVVALGLLHLAGGLGLGDVKLGGGLALPLAAIDPARAVVAPALGFVLAGLWTLPLVLRGDRARVPFGPFQLAAFWIVIAAP